MDEIRIKRNVRELRLIGMATELLHALKIAHKELERITSAIATDQIQSHVDGDTAEALYVARTTIAKAERE